MDSVKASPNPPLDPSDFSAQFAAAAQTHGFQSEQFGEIHGHALTAFSKTAPESHPRIYLSSGIHGDEPAAPWALLRLLQTGFFDNRCHWYICPLLNPTGFLRQTRENFAQADLNRDYKSLLTGEVQSHVAWLQRQPKFDLVICCHEDWEAQGFYLYELSMANRPTLAHVMLDAARAHSPIEEAAVIDGRESIEPGIIRPISDPLLRDTWPEALFLAYRPSPRNYTIETASAQPIEQRITTQVAVLRAAVGVFLQQKH